MQVDFVIGGTQKGGTSALDSFLRQHPQICLPEMRKELHFFDRAEEDRDYKKYHENFRPQPRHLILGEASPIYMYWETAPYRIWHYNPRMKWILTLRNPVERAFSAWNMERKRGHETLSFEEAIDREPERCREALPLQHRVYSYIDRGFYAHQVRRLFNIFGRDNCLIILNEELRKEHEGTLRRIFDFLKVDNATIPPPADVFDQAYDGKMSDDVRKRLAESFYFDMKELELLLNRDLSSWYGR